MGALVAGAPVLAHDQHKDAEAPYRIVEAADLVVDRLRVAAEEDTLVDEVLHAEMGAAPAFREVLIEAAAHQRTAEVTSVQIPLGLLDRVGHVAHAGNAHLAALGQPAARAAGTEVDVDHV